MANPQILLPCPKLVQCVTPTVRCATGWQPACLLTHACPPSHVPFVPPLPPTARSEHCHACLHEQYAEQQAALQALGNMALPDNLQQLLAAQARC